MLFRVRPLQLFLLFFVTFFLMYGGVSRILLMKKRQARHPRAEPGGPWWWLWLGPGTGCDDRECPAAGEHDEHVRWLRGSGGHGGLARRARGSRAFRTFVPQYVYARDSVSPPHRISVGKGARLARDGRGGMLSL